MTQPLKLHRTVVGVDASSSWIGMARLGPEGAKVEAIAMLQSRQRSWDQRIVPAMARLAVGAALVAIEQPPVTSRAMNRQGSQAVVGFGIGRACGLVEASAYVMGVPVEYVQVSDWRRTRDWLGRGARISLPVGAGDVKGDASDVNRDKEKAYAWALADRFWPEQLRPVVLAAQERAKVEGQRPWRLAGVSDASESLFVALHYAVRAGPT